jgi:N-methylhydantoinase B
MSRKKEKKKKEDRKELDPITYEVLKHKIWQILWEGREAMLHVSGSPVVSEAKECMFAIYDAEGNTISSAAGLLLHVIGAEQMIKNIMEWYKDEPGIYDGDIFFFNDPYVGGVHAPDQACITPVFVKDRLLLWIADLTHTPETGAIAPGGMIPSATEIFHEGLRVPGLKVMEKGKIRRDTYKLMERSVRDPGMYILDVRARVAGLNVAKERMLELIDKYGFDLLKQVFDQMIIDAEKSARAKLRELPDGKWRSVVYLDHDGSKYNLQKLMVTVTKEGDELTIDYTGTDPQGPGPVNSALPGTHGNTFVAISSLLFWEEHWNRGTMNAVKIIAPEGTLLNPKWPAACAMSPAWPGICMSNMLDICFSKMFITREKYYGDQNAAWYAHMEALISGGIDQYGNPYGSLLFDPLASGQGAGSSFDGVDTGAFQMTPEVIASDVEMYETIVPYIYIVRKQSVDGGGPGKYRGGASLDCVYMVYDTDNNIAIPIGMGKLASHGPGLYGGYPASQGQLWMALNTDIKEWFDNSSAPYDLNDIKRLKGDIKNYPPMAMVPTKGWDVIYCYNGGGGGYGDPIDRDPEVVLKDVINYITSFEYAENVYGVIIDKDRMIVDYEKTEKKREEIKNKRKERANKFPQKEPNIVPLHLKDKTNVELPMRIHEYLEIDADRNIKCLKCGYIFCDGKENYKEYALKAEVPGKELGSKFIQKINNDDPEFVVYHEFYCPGCLTLLEVDVLPPGHPPIWDIKIKL